MSKPRLSVIGTQYDLDHLTKNKSFKQFVKGKLLRIRFNPSYLSYPSDCE